MTASIPIKRFGDSANSIAVSKGTPNYGTKFNSDAKKSDRSCRNGVDAVTGF